MSVNTELNSRLIVQSEEKRSHVEYSREYEFYKNVSDGNIAQVKKVLADPKDIYMYEKPEYGRLSNDFLRNMRYHFVVSAALLTRFCTEKGLERELAYTLSDIYINRMDNAPSAEKIIVIHNEMLMDLTKRMSEIPKKNVYSLYVIKAMEYICRHRTQRLTVQMLADELKINRSYLSSIFKKETGVSVSGYIRTEKIGAAANMLRFSEYSCSEIAEYFGFASQSHFIDIFRRETGLTPKEYRKRYQRNQEIFGESRSDT